MRISNARCCRLTVSTQFWTCKGKKKNHKGGWLGVRAKTVTGYFTMNQFFGAVLSKKQPRNIQHFNTGGVNKGSEWPSDYFIYLQDLRLSYFIFSQQPQRYKIYMWLFFIVLMKSRLSCGSLITISWRIKKTSDPMTFIRLWVLIGLALSTQNYLYMLCLFLVLSTQLFLGKLCTSLLLIRRNFLVLCNRETDKKWQFLS